MLNSPDDDSMWQMSMMMMILIRKVKKESISTTMNYQEGQAVRKVNIFPIVDEYNTDIVDNKLLPMLMTMLLILPTLMAVLLILFEYY